MLVQAVPSPQQKDMAAAGSRPSLLPSSAPRPNLYIQQKSLYIDVDCVYFLTWRVLKHQGIFEHAGKSRQLARKIRIKTIHKAIIKTRPHSAGSKTKV